MRYQVCRNLLQPWLCTDKFGQLRPAPLRFLSLRNILLVLDHLVDILVQFVDLLTIDVDFDEAAFVVDRNRGTVIDRVLNVVNADIVAEDAARVFVFLVDRRAGEADERRAGQGVSHVLGVAEDVLRTGDFAGFRVLDLLQPSLQAVLAAVGFVGDHDDITAITKLGVIPFIIQQRELLHGCKDDAARFAGGQHLAEFFAAVGLFGRLHFVSGKALAADVLGHAELLAVQFVAVGDHDQRRVLNSVSRKALAARR